MKALSKLIILSFSFIVWSSSFAALVDDKTSNFINTRGSKLTLTAKADESKKSGSLTGSFTTAVASKDCQQVIGKPIPIIGSYVGNAVAFTVSYPECGAVVAIVGNFDGDNISTLWIDVHQGDHTNKQDWNTRLIGNDTFMPVK